jgi:pimeloyl-ACP methyl ester carboxylesterase
MCLAFGAKTMQEYQKKTLVLLIPGNPSVPGIYEPFLNKFIKDLNISGELYSQVLPHLGQCNTREIIRKSIRVHDVIEDHKEKINTLLKEHRPDQIFLIGHSLGSAITIELYHEFGDQIDHYFVLCPFLGPSPNNKGYLKLFKNPVSRLGMKGITYSALKSSRLSHEIFKRWLGDNPFNQHIPKEIAKPYYLKNFFSLVSNYFEDFEELGTRHKVGQMDPKKSFFLLAPNDYWVPPETLDYLPRESTIVHCQDVPHDFCLNPHHYSKVSAELSRYIHSIKLL